MFILPFFYLLTSGITLVSAQKFSTFSDFDEINYLEYYMEFNPNANGFNSTKYSVNFKHNLHSVQANFRYNNLSLTRDDKNYNYYFSKDEYKITTINNKLYEPYLESTNTELLMNTTNIGNPQIFRVDETVIFSNYLRKGHFKEIKKINIPFEYQGNKTFKTKFSTEIDSIHYYADYEWLSDGIF